MTLVHLRAAGTSLVLDARGPGLPAAGVCIVVLPMLVMFVRLGRRITQGPTLSVSNSPRCSPHVHRRPPRSDGPPTLLKGATVWSGHITSSRIGVALAALAVVCAGTTGAVAAASTTAGAATAKTATGTTAATDSGRCADGTATPPAGRTWQQTFADEFNSTTLDTSKWNTYMDFPGRAGKYHHNDNYLSYALDKNIILDGGGTLKLRAQKETVQGTDPVGTFDYSEGFVASHDTFYQRQGYWEICAKYPAGKGMWPAFWTAPQNRTWPGEYDIAEWFGGQQHMFMGHVAGGSYHQQKWYGQYVDGTAPTEGWHTYGLEWRNGYVAYYVDGVKHHEVTDGVSNEQMYIILNSGVAAYAKHGGPPDATNTWPADFEVDYVRVYAEDGSPATRR